MRYFENFCFWLLSQVVFDKWYNRWLLGPVWHFGITRYHKRVNKENGWI